MFLFSRKYCGNNRDDKQVKGASKESDELAYEVANKLLCVTSLLAKVLARLLMDEVPINADMYRYRINKYKVIKEFPRTTIYKIMVDGEVLPISFKEASFAGTLSIGITNAAMKVLLSKDKSTASRPIIVSLGKQMYTFPPKDYSSYMFFKLNNDIAEEITRIAKKLDVLGEAGQQMIDLSIVEEKVADVNVPELIRKEHYEKYDMDVRGVIYFDEGLVGALKYVESSLNSHSQDIAYRVALRIGSREAIYTISEGDKVFGLSVLLKNFLKAKELEFIDSVVLKIGNTAAKSYVVMKAYTKTYM